MNFLIITGMSGAGKSTCMHTLEDFGYNCIDNVPPQFLKLMISFAAEVGGDKDLALAVDSRSGDMSVFAKELDELDKSAYDCKLVFIDCSVQELINRYKETRRKHPLMNDQVTSVEEAINREKEMMQQFKEKADYLFDTTFIETKQFRQQVIDMITNDSEARLQVKLISFGFKYGIPSDADLVFDVRCLPNPFYVPELKNLTGMDEAVYDYVFSFEQSREVARMIKELLEYSIPLFIEEGKSQLVVAVGCTGGHHRSTSFARYFEKNLSSRDISVSVWHRDIDRFD